MIILISLLLFPNLVQSKVFWTIKTHPVRFGAEVELFCNTSASSCNNCTRTWFQKTKILTFQHSTIDRKKYDTIFRNDGFGLIVRHFSEQDINTSYKCSYGFEQYEMFLPIGENMEKIPKKNDIYTTESLTANGRRLDITIQIMKVYPVPNCNAFFMKMNLSKNFNMINKTRSGLLYNVLFLLSYEGNCQNGMLNVFCSIGTHKMNVMGTKISIQCTGAQSSETTNYELKRIVSGVLILMLVVSYFCFLVSKPLKRKQNNTSYLKGCKNTNRYGEIQNHSQETTESTSEPLIGNLTRVDSETQQNGNIFDLSTSRFTQGTGEVTLNRNTSHSMETGNIFEM